jgi:hypothetical protein
MKMMDTIFVDYTPWRATQIIKEGQTREDAMPFGGASLNVPHHTVNIYLIRTHDSHKHSTKRKGIL